MPKKRLVLIVLVAIIFVAAISFLIHRNYQSTPDSPESVQTAIQTAIQTATSSVETFNEPNIGFAPTYQEAATPLSQVPNYQALKTKYGLNLSVAQEKYLDKNRFLLIDYDLSLIHISEPTRRTPISYAVFCL